MALAATLIACAGDPMESGMDPFAPMVFKEGSTKMPESPPNKSSLLSFYVSPSTIFKFSVDTQSISIGADGVTRYIVVITNPSGEEQAQYEGIRCDSYQWKLYGNFENGQWKENPLAEWRDIKMKVGMSVATPVNDPINVFKIKINKEEKKLMLCQKEVKFVGGDKSIKQKKIYECSQRWMGVY